MSLPCKLFINSFVHSLKKYRLHIYHVLGTALSTEKNGTMPKIMLS